MKFIDFNGRSHIFNFSKICRESPNPSGLHLSAREAIKKQFPHSSIYEEVTLLGTGLVADFFIPDLKVMIEIHGQQHYKFVKHFHKTQAGFTASQKRDRLKQEWCEINDVVYVELPFDSKDKWAKILRGL